MMTVASIRKCLSSTPTIRNTATWLYSTSSRIWWIGNEWLVLHSSMTVWILYINWSVVALWFWNAYGSFPLTESVLWCWKSNCFWGAIVVTYILARLDFCIFIKFSRHGALSRINGINLIWPHTSTRKHFQHFYIIIYNHFKMKNHPAYRRICKEISDSQ